MKLLAHTGFEWGRAWKVLGGSSTTDSLTTIKSYIKAATKGMLELKGTGDTLLLYNASKPERLGTRYPSVNGSRSIASVLTLRSARSTHLHLQQNVSKGFELSMAQQVNANISSSTADQDFTFKFTSGGSDYTFIWDSNGLRLFGVAGSSFQPPTNDSTTGGEVKTNFARFFHAQVWVDANNDLNVRAVAKDAPSQIIHWNITGAFTPPSDIEISTPEETSVSSNIDDLTIYEIEDSSDFPAQDATTNDFKPVLREVALIAKSSTEQNVKFYFPDGMTPGDWKASTNGVESDISDGVDMTYAEAGLDRVGWEQWINSGTDAISTITIKDSEGNDLSWGAIHNIKLHHWRVADDDGENFTAGAEASTAVNKSDGTTAHLISSPQTKTLQGVSNQSGMLTANWDFSGLTGSDGVPIDETALTDLKMSIKKA